MTRWIIVGVGIGAIAVLALFFLIFAQKPAAPMGEDGTFANDCCGTVQLSEGKMVLNDSATVRYSVERDAEGPYILPRSYVGVRQYQGFDVDGTRKVVKLRLDKLPNPGGIVLYEGRSSFVFARQKSAAGTAKGAER